MVQLQKIFTELKESGFFKTTFQMAIVYVMFYFTFFKFLHIQYITNIILCIAIYLYISYWFAKKLHRQLDRSLHELRMQSRESKPVSDEDMEWTAYHEAGHALVARLASNDLRIKSITIIPNKSQHYAGQVRTDKKNRNLTASNMLNSIKVSLAGMIAEDIAFNEHAVGCRTDLRHAKDNVYHMLQDLNMGKKIIYNDKRELDAEAEQILQDEKVKTKKILTDNWSILVDLKDELMIKQYMNEEEINTFFEKYGI